ncbi:MAG: DUF1624 domain-containing protein, partial [Planctomycetaceae bacterium]|nr:DUF1624 domain-containing protein [Planctomycetaceae bacterium]
MRYLSIDVLRMMAIFVMVLVHFAENLAGTILPIAGLGAPVFAFLSGCSYKLWLAGVERKQIPENEIFRISMRRGLFVFSVGLLFNVLVWFPEEIFNWDVLTFIGAALIFLNLTRRLPLQVLIAIAVVALLISPFLRAMADYNSYWQQLYFDPDMTLPDVVIGFLAVGYFPFFPW